MDVIDEFQSAHEIASAIAGRRYSSTDIVEHYLQRIDQLNPTVKAYVQVLHNLSRRLAAERDAELAAGLRRGPLHGVPVTIKDCLDLHGVPTTQGNRFFETSVAGSSATVVERLLAAGAVPVAKGNLPEFTLGFNTVSDVGGQTRNPHDFGRSPGGSSGGEAAGVAAGLAPLGIGTDVGGSVRFPAHCCGVVGFKPSAGTLPLDGAWPNVLYEFNCIGTLSTSILDAELTFQVMSGTAAAGGLAVQGGYESALKRWTARMGEIRVGYVHRAGLGPVDAQTAAAIDDIASRLAQRKVTIATVDLTDLLPLYDETTFGHLCVAEIKKYLHDNAIPFDRLSPLTRARLDAESDSVYAYLDARENLRAIRAVLDRTFASVDVIICPVSPTVAPVLAESDLLIDDQRWPVRRSISLAGLFSLGGNPAVSVPYRYSEEGLPIGVQVVGARGSDGDAIALAGVIESMRPEALRRPRQIPTDWHHALDRADAARSLGTTSGG